MILSHKWICCLHSGAKRATCPFQGAFQKSHWPRARDGPGTMPGAQGLELTHSTFVSLIFCSVEMKSTKYLHQAAQRHRIKYTWVSGLPFLEISFILFIYLRNDWCHFPFLLSKCFSKWRKLKKAAQVHVCWAIKILSASKLKLPNSNKPLVNVWFQNSRVSGYMWSFQAQTLRNQTSSMVTFTITCSGDFGIWHMFKLPNYVSI